MHKSAVVLYATTNDFCLGKTSGSGESLRRNRTRISLPNARGSDTSHVTARIFIIFQDLDSPVSACLAFIQANISERHLKKSSSTLDVAVPIYCQDKTYRYNSACISKYGLNPAFPASGMNALSQTALLHVHLSNLTVQKSSPQIHALKSAA